jgi:hypothetical protein
MDIRLEVLYKLTEITDELVSKVRQELGEKILKLNTPCGISQMYSKKNAKDETLIFYVNVSIHKDFEFSQNKNNKQVIARKKKYPKDAPNKSYLIVNEKIRLYQDEDGIYKEQK